MFHISPYPNLKPPRVVAVHVILAQPLVTDEAQALVKFERGRVRDLRLKHKLVASHRHSVQNLNSETTP